MTTPCPKCGTINKPNARFCARCGTQIAGPTAPIAPPSPPKPPAPAPPPPQPTAQVPPPSQPTAQVPPPSQPTAQVPPPMPSVPCPHCGRPNRSGARRCAHCGKPMAIAPAGPPPAPPPPLPAPPPAMPPARARPPFVSIGILIVLVLCLCASLSSIVVLESGRPTLTPTIDIAKLPPTPTFTPPPSPTPAIAATPTPTATPNPPYPVVFMKITADGRFGFMTREGDPKNPKDDNKPLTYRQEGTTKLADGDTNNTRVWVDGQTPLYGGKEGKFIQAPALASNDAQMSAVWQVGQLVITQTVQVVLSTSTHRLDTFRIDYLAENRDTITHTVGIRLMLDTLIGENDGVPFIVPGRSGLITSPLDLKGSEIPNFVQVYENADLNNPGVIIQVTLTGGDATTPDRFVIAPWCDENASWDFLQEVGGLANKTLRQCGDAGKRQNKLDSAIGIFFEPKPLGAGETRQWTTFYGLGEIKKREVTSALSLAKPPDRVRVNEEFWIAALVQNTKPGQRLKLELPPELQLTQGAAEQAVAPANVPLTQISWRVRAVTAANNVVISVVLTPENAKESVQVSVLPLPTPTATRTPKPCTPSVTQPTCP